MPFVPAREQRTPELTKEEKFKSLSVVENTLAPPSVLKAKDAIGLNASRNGLHIAPTARSHSQFESPIDVYSTKRHWFLMVGNSSMYRAFRGSNSAGSLGSSLILSASLPVTRPPKANVTPTTLLVGVSLPAGKLPHRANDCPVYSSLGSSANPQSALASRLLVLVAMTKQV